ncbi:MAG: hypothetical protein L0Z62_09400 [Gemmataceae bacterium]|nr:hypothetical protein [Gemmataceae bacterium]
MSTIRVTIHSVGSGTCSLTGKEGMDGLVVTFDDGTVKEAHLGWKAFRQILGLKVAQTGKPEPKPAVPVAVPIGNGPAK